MKKFILTLLTLLLVGGSVMADGRKRTIDPENLPKPAIELIQKHWPSCVIDYAFIDGTMIEFNSKGVWKEMKCTDGLPVTLVPGNITRYVVNRYPKQLIIKCEKMRGGYEVKLTNGLEIQFDMQGRVTHVDD